jgi:hypothetical protein
MTGDVRVGTFRTWKAALTMLVHQGKVNLTVGRSERGNNAYSRGFQMVARLPFSCRFPPNTQA